MGSCDWNDAFSLVGENGKGESIFTTLLYILALKAFIPIMEQKGDREKAERYRERAEILHNAVEQRGFFGDRYARAVCDDGEILGIEDSEECKIDILSQAFAAMAGLDSERVKTALNTAISRLYDSENRIMKLFSPPFRNGKARVGYIRGYVAGIRENGGQYTHGALWGALGCFSVGMAEEGLKILDCANPITRYADRALGNRYKTEPYAVTADIYSGKFGGRGGWSWYTGAAAWLYRISLEYVYGIKLGGYQTLLSAKPIIPYTAEIQTGNASIHVFAAENITEPKLDGENVRFPIAIPNGKHILELPIKR